MTAKPRKSRPPKPKPDKARVMVRVSREAKAKLELYAAQLTGERGKFVGMAQALEEVLLALPTKKKAA